MIQNEKFVKIYKEEPTYFFENGGRFELLGNHTDHNHGWTLSSACDLVIQAWVSKRNDNTVCLVSKGYDPEISSLDNLDVNDNDKSFCFVRGVARYLKDNNYKIGGANIYMESQIPSGAGVSSSAALEICIGRIFSVLYNDGKIDDLTLSKAGQFAENNYFHKGSGLLDQISVAFGGISHIDFGNIANPIVKNLPASTFDGYTFVIADTGKSHSDLSDAYSSIPNDMFKAAKVLGVNFLRESSLEELLKHKDEIEPLPFSRAKHFFEENQRVLEAYQCLLKKDIKSFAEYMNKSQYSSRNLLHNTMINDVYEGSMAEAVDFAYDAMDHKGGARINGGGFAGSIITLVPNEVLDKYLERMNERFGKEHVFVVHSRSN